MILENKCLNIRDVSWDFFLFFNFMYFYVPRLLLENKTQPLRLRTNVLLIFY